MATIINSLSTKVDKSSGLSEILIRFFNGRHLNQRAKSNIFVNATNWDEKKQCIIIPSNRLKEVKLRELSEELHKKNTLLYNLRIYIFNAFEEAGAGKTELPDDWLKSVVQKFYETSSEQTAKPAKISKKSAPAKPAPKPTPQPKKASRNLWLNQFSNPMSKTRIQLPKYLLSSPSSPTSSPKTTSPKTASVTIVSSIVRCSVTKHIIKSRSASTILLPKPSKISSVIYPTSTSSSTTIN